MALTKAQFTKIALSFPEALENSIVWLVDSMDERDHLLEIDPKTYFITPHYKDYPSVLVRAERIDAAMLKKMMERRWRKVAPKSLVKKLDEAVVSVKTVAAKKVVRRAARKTSVRKEK